MTIPRKPDIELLKDIYGHIIYQYDLIDKANESLSARSMNMAGFCGVLLGLMVSVLLELKSNKTSYDFSMFFLFMALLFIATLFYIGSVVIDKSKGLVKPENLIKNYNDGIPPHKFWEKYVEFAQKAYRHSTGINRKKSRYSRFGDLFFILSNAVLFYFVISIFKNC